MEAAVTALIWGGVALVWAFVVACVIAIAEVWRDN